MVALLDALNRCASLCMGSPTVPMARLGRGGVRRAVRCGALPRTEHGRCHDDAGELAEPQAQTEGDDPCRGITLSRLRRQLPLFASGE